MSDDGEKYQANRNDNNQASDSSKKAAKVAAKAAADYFTGGKGGAVVDKLADTKLGNAVLNTAGKALEKQPGFAKAAKKLDDSGALDTADKGLSVIEGAGTGGAAGAENAASSGTDIASKGAATDKGGQSLLPSLGDTLGKNKKKPSSSDLDDIDDIDVEDDESSFDSDTETKGKGIIKAIWDMLDPITKMFIILIGFFLFIIMLGVMFIIIQLSSEKSGNNVSIVGSGSCNYRTNGFSVEGKKHNREINITNLKVRLMNCNGSGAVEGEELVDFEKYILGVVYQENGGGSDEGIKTEAVAARSFALARPAAMGNAAGIKLSEENGQWILQLRACTYDQAYCDPDKGCWSTTKGGESGGTMHSGQSSSAIWSRPPLPADSKIRTLVESTKGQVVVTSDNYIIHTTYKSGAQTAWNASNLDYKQILLQHYASMGAADILQMECSSESTDGSGSATTGQFTTWKQYDPTWGSVPIGNSGKTIQNIGCTVTSVAMLVAKSGVSVNISNFNPGTFVQALNNNGGFTPGGALNWANVTKIAPSFVYLGQTNVSNLSRDEKLAKLKTLVDSGYYVIAEVKGRTGQHWVAVDNISGDRINMFDPGSSSTDMWGEYNWANTSVFSYYKIS
ncbi:MAG: SpoIID/LytB domain-containing protein [bacterium]|nr:SpoIID/LytB domain-containing protein [bacterium]